MKTIEEINARLAQVAPYRFVKPLSHFAEAFIGEMKAADRWTFGLDEVDQALRGLGKGTLTYLIGVPHAGKTQMLLTGLWHNRNRRQLLCSADDSGTLVLAKLVAIATGIPGDRLEAGVLDGDERVIDIIRSTAANLFPGLLVVEEPLSSVDLDEALSEAIDYWGGERPDIVIYDYFDMFLGAADEEMSQAAKSKSLGFKLWAKRNDVPLLVLAHVSLERGKPGMPLTMAAMRSAGQAEAFQMIGVWRQKDRETATASDLEKHALTITIGVLKNKRPPCRLGVCTYQFDDKGLIIPWRRQMQIVPPAHLATWNGASD